MACFRTSAVRSVSAFFVAAVLAGHSSLEARRSLIVLAGLLIVLLATPLSVPAQVPVPTSEPAPQVDISQLTAVERADLLSRLSDELGARAHARLLGRTGRVGDQTDTAHR